LNLEYYSNHANQVLNTSGYPQEIIDTEADVSLDEPEPKPTGVITLINNYTGGIEVMASGIPFEEEQYNLATQGKEKSRLSI